MFVLALVAAVRTRPKPAIFPILYGLNKVLAYDICSCLRVAVLG